MTKHEHDALTRVNYGGRMGNRTAYRRERGAVEGVDRLAAREAGWVQYRAALRAIGAGRGSSALRAVVHAWEIVRR